MATPKATTIKEAIKRFEDKTKCNATEAAEGMMSNCMSELLFFLCNNKFFCS